MQTEREKTRERIERKGEGHGNDQEWRREGRKVEERKKSEHLSKQRRKHKIEGKNTYIKVDEIEGEVGGEVYGERKRR
jgi:hypothetical protein